MSDGSKNKESMRNILIVALSVCFACSIVVSGTAVLLKPQLIANKEIDRNKNILLAAGLLKEDTRNSDIDSLFESFRLRVVDLEDKKVLSDAEVAELGIDPVRYDQKRASRGSTSPRTTSRSSSVR